MRTREVGDLEELVLISRTSENIPMMAMTAFTRIKGDLMWYLSPAQAIANMTMAAATYGGATRH